MKWGFATLFVLAMLTYTGWEFCQARWAPPRKHIYIVTSDKCAREIASRLKEFATDNDLSFKASISESVFHQKNRESRVHKIDTFELDRWNASISAFYDFTDDDPSTLKYFVSLQYGGWLWPTESKETDRLGDALMSKLKRSSCVKSLELTQH
jgi:hypothetical protein